MRPRTVTAEQILEAADAAARQEGIDRFTIRSVCAKLQVAAPAIYRYFPSKSLITHELINRIIGRTELPGPEEGDWAERVRRCFVSVHDAVAPYGGLAAQMGREIPRTVAGERNDEWLRSVLAEAGLVQADAERVLYVIFVYTWGDLLASTSAPEWSRGPSSRTSRAVREQFLWGLDQLVNAMRHQFSPRRGAQNEMPSAAGSRAKATVKSRAHRR
jgi:AcrR family transcriptional regulator